MDLDKLIDGLEVDNDFQPVSFSFHNEIGNILHSDEPTILKLDESEKEFAPTELIPFIP